jgi:hypothetical protein
MQKSPDKLDQIQEDWKPELKFLAWADIGLLE